MDFSILLLKKTITLALMVMMGFLSVKSGHVKSRDSAVISQLCFDWVIPLSLINSFIIDYTPEVARDFRFACLSALLMVVLFVCLSFPVKKLFRLTPSEQGSLMFANSAGMALPLAASLFGTTGVLFCAPHMGVQNLLIFTLLPVIMSNNQKIDWKKLFLNRNILAIFVGIAIFTLRLPIPDVLRDTISGVGDILGPLSMFMIGMLMGEIDFKELLKNKDLYLVCFIRLILWPGIAIALIALSGITRRLPYTRDVLLVLIMCIASPAATLVTQMATAHRGIEEAKAAGSLNVMTTLPCVITIPLMVLVYQMVVG